MIYDTECSAENTNGNCCGLSHKCDENQGDCDSDSDCKCGLKCGDDNCQGFPDSTYDCCYKAKSSKHKYLPMYSCLEYIIYTYYISQIMTTIVLDQKESNIIYLQQIW